MALKTGTDIQLKINASYIAAETDTSMSMAADMLDKTTKSSASAAKEYMAGETGGTITATGLYDPSQTMGGNDIIALLQAKASATVIWGEGTTNVDLFYCTGLISGVTVNGPKNDVASYSVDIQLTGVVNETKL